MSLEALHTYLKEPARIVYGTRQTIKQIKLDIIKEIFLAKNCSPEAREKILHYAKLADFKVNELSQSSEELSLICKKDFPVSILSVVEEKHEK